MCLTRRKSLMFNQKFPSITSLTYLLTKRVYGLLRFVPFQSGSIHSIQTRLTPSPQTRD